MTDKTGVRDNISAAVRYEDFIPSSHANHPKDSEHFVQFYESDDFLLNSLAKFISEGLDAGDVCLIVATQEHRDRLDAQLKSAGKNLKPAQTDGQILKNADQTGKITIR